MAFNSAKLSVYRKSIKSFVSPCKCSSSRRYSVDSAKKFLTFDEVVTERQTQARRSFVVQVNSESSFSEFYNYCSRYAPIAGVHHFKNHSDKHFMLIELLSEESARNLLQTCSTHLNIDNVLRSPFLWFRAVSGRKRTELIPSSELNSRQGNDIITDEQLIYDLVKCDTVSDQIQMVYDKTTLNDVGIRLRFLVARQLEVILESLYTNVCLKPFGSSVNGFGKMGCDLDMVLTNNMEDDYDNKEKRLVYYEKMCDDAASNQIKHMQLLSELLELRVPGATRIIRVLHARVPIVKYSHDFTDVQCDVCYNNMSGVYMSELLWLYSCLDHRVKPLTFIVRRWAQNMGLTNRNPGNWITNFPLTLMVLFFLQQETYNGAILPPLNYLISCAAKEDIRLAQDNLNCTFLRDLNRLPQNAVNKNQSNLQTLLFQFFEFYSQFDFHESAISIIKGKAVSKPNNQPLYIVNPLEQTLNVSRNVNEKECQRIISEIRNAAWAMESIAENKSGQGDEWGIISVIEHKANREIKKLLRAGNSHRLVSVKDLFTGEDEVPQKNILKQKINALSAKSDVKLERNVRNTKQLMKEQDNNKAKEPIRYKNSSVANLIKNLRKNKFI